MLIKRGKTWHSLIMFDGGLYQQSLRTRNKDTTTKLEAAFRTSLIKGEFGIVDSRRAPTLAQFEDRLLPHLKATVAPRRYGFYKQNIAALKRFAPLASSRLGNIDSSLIEKFIQFRIKEKVAPLAVNHSLRTIRPALHIAKEWKMIRDVPLIKMLPGDRERGAVIDESEVGRMTDYIGKAYPTSLMRQIVPFLIDTGLRISEACGLLKSNVRFDDGQPCSIKITKGKSNYAKREIPLTLRAAVAVTACLPQSRSAFVFTSKGGRRPLTRHYPSEQFRTIRDAVNLGFSTEHGMRSALGWERLERVLSRSRS
jgi:integrase